MNKPAICKACGKLMGTSNVCPYCGTSRTSIKSNVYHLKRSLKSASTSYCELIIKVTIGMYIIEVLLGTFMGSGGLLGTIMSGPNSKTLLFLGASSPGVFSHGHWWGPFTATLLHGGLMHIGFNLFALYQIGPLLEQATTKSFFLFTYILTGICGFLLSASMGYLSVGASAALYGLIGCGISISFILGQGKDDPLFRGLVTWLIYGVIFAFLMPGIDHYAHLGGLIGGLGLGFIWTKLRMAVWFRGFTEKVSLIMVLATFIGLIHSGLNFYKYFF